MLAHDRELSMTTLGQKLYATRKKNRFTLAALAKVVGSSPSYLSSLERDLIPNPSVTIIRRLADAMEVSVAFLLDDSTEFETGDQAIAALVNRVINLDNVKRAALEKFLTAIE
jgi:transcriptional regulator with XRE-family HTH domain